MSTAANSSRAKKYFSVFVLKMAFECVIIC